MKWIWPFRFTGRSKRGCYGCMGTSPRRVAEAVYEMLAEWLVLGVAFA